MTDEAKAVGELAKLGQEIVKATGGAGRYLADILASVPQDLIGLAGGDWLRHKRERNLATLFLNTHRHLEAIEDARKSDPSPSLLLPLLEAAKDEDREELQALWAALLASAMLDGGKRVRRAFFDTVRQMEPMDAKFLWEFYRLEEQGRPLEALSQEPMWIILHRLLVPSSFTDDEFTVSAESLIGLKCIQTGKLTSFGKALLRACQAT
jgi:hypothetical protein